MKKIIDFSKFSSIKIGDKHEVEIIEEEIHLPKNSYILGACNNILVCNSKKFFMLSKTFSFIKESSDGIHIGAKTSSGEILKFAKEYNLKGFELLRKLPGSLGGMIKMNAGLKEYEIFNHLIRIKTENGWLEKKDINYGYRFTDIKGIIYEAIFEKNIGFDKALYSQMEIFRNKQPKEPSCGSCFKNPKGDFAARLIEQAGLKGYQIGGAAFSDKHANFLINLQNATCKDIKNLISLAQKEVKEKFDIDLQEEIIII